jgi:hypothetical protein
MANKKKVGDKFDSMMDVAIDGKISTYKLKEINTWAVKIYEEKAVPEGKSVQIAIRRSPGNYGFTLTHVYHN